MFCIIANTSNEISFSLCHFIYSGGTPAILGFEIVFQAVKLLLFVVVALNIFALIVFEWILV